MSERAHLESAMAALEAQRTILGDDVVETALRQLRERLAALVEGPTEQRKLVTVLFADVTGFTSLSRKMDPEEVASAMNSLWRRVDATLTDHGATIDKHIGDAVMALFGAPVAREDDAERAVRAALALQEVVTEVGREIVGKEESHGLRMRVGLHTGPVHLGTVGSGHEYTAIGDTVNVASRLEEAAPPGGVLISHDTFSHVRDRFELRARGPIAIRGRDELRVYEVKGLRSSLCSTCSTVGGKEVPFVGREEELGRLLAAAAGIESAGGPTAVTIVAEAGLGASSLLAAFSSRLREEGRAPEILEAKSLPAPDGTSPSRKAPEILEARGGGAPLTQAPYRVLRDILSFRFGIRERESDAQAVDKLVAGMTSLVGDSARESAHLIGHLVGFRLSESPFISGILDDPAQIRRRAFRAFLDILKAMVIGRPYVVIVLEDIQWADDDSLDLLEEILAKASELPLLLVCTARPNLFSRPRTWLEGERRMRLDLGPLDEEASGRLLDAILARAKVVPPALREQIMETAEGHPLYIEELVRRLIDEGVIDTEGPEWRIEADHPSTMRTPPTLTALVQARLDALPRNELRLLQKAAVLGRVFWEDALRALEADPDVGAASRAGDLEPALQGLLDRELIVERPEPVFEATREFSFAQSLVHEVSYETILLRLRPVVHRRAAMWLADRAGDAAPMWARRIAEHWEAAGERTAAGAWLLKAADHARRTNSLAEAEASYRKAIDHLDQSEAATALRLSASFGLAEVYQRLVRLSEVEEVCRTMTDLAAEIGDRISESQAWGVLAQVFQGRSETQAALDASERAVKLARGEGAPGALANALRDRALCLHRAGRYNEARQPLAEALSIATAENLVPERAKTLRLLGLVQARLGRFDEARKSGLEALELLRGMSHKTLLTASLISLGELARVRGEASEAYVYYQEAIAIARDQGLTGHELVALGNMGAALVAMGEVDEAEAALREVLARAPSKWYGLPETWRFLAEAMLKGGRLDEAMEAAASALEHAVPTGSAEMIGASLRVLGEVAAARRGPVDVEGERLDAMTCLERSLETLEEAGVGPEAARTVLAMSRCCELLGDSCRSKALRSEAVARFDALGMSGELAAL